jgi:hypothetical protein
MLTVPAWLQEDPRVYSVTRIDLGLEGDWSPTVRCVWDPASGFRGWGTLETNRLHRPCLELYLSDGWIGVHCFRLIEDRYEFDQERAMAIIEYVEAQQLSQEL